MTLFQIRDVAIKLHPSILALAVLCLLTGGGARLPAALGLVLCHEAAHGLAARRLGFRVLEIELAPFGGVARIAGLEDRPGAEALVALAGPAANLLLAMAACLACQLWPMLAGDLAGFIALNLCLCGFNLLPALPLDGGRLLRAALLPWLGRSRAGSVAAALGVALGAALAALGVALFWLSGRANLTLLVSGGYIALCALKLRRERPFEGARELLRLERESLRGRVLPVRLLAAPAGTNPVELMRRFRPDRLHLVVFVDEELRAVGKRWQGEIVAEALGRGQGPQRGEGDISI